MLAVPEEINTKFLPLYWAAFKEKADKLFRIKSLRKKWKHTREKSTEETEHVWKLIFLKKKQEKPSSLFA